MDSEELQRFFEEAAANAPHVPMADVSFEIGRAMLVVLTRRFGSEFARDVLREILQHADDVEATGDPRDIADAPEIREIANGGLWARLGVTAPPSDPVLGGRPQAPL